MAAPARPSVSSTLRRVILRFTGDTRLTSSSASRAALPHLGDQLPGLRLLLRVEELEDLRLRPGAGECQLRLERRDLLHFSLEQAVVCRDVEDRGVERLPRLAERLQFDTQCVPLVGEERVDAAFWYVGEPSSRLSRSRASPGCPGGGPIGPRPPGPGPNCPPAGGCGGESCALITRADTATAQRRTATTKIWNARDAEVLMPRLEHEACRRGSRVFLGFCFVDCARLRREP